MKPFTTVLAILAGSILWSTGCSNLGNVSTALPIGGGDRTVYRFTPNGEHARIREFADLPRYSSFYGPAAVTSMSGSLWVADDIDQDFGECAVVQAATSGKALNTFYYPGVSSQGSSFLDMAAGPDGALWITDYYNGQILRLSTSGHYSGFPLTNYDAPVSIVAGPDRALWFTTEVPTIGRITTSGRIKTFSTPALAFDIASGPDGALWFTEPGNDSIGRVTTHGKITIYSKGITAGSEPYSIAPGPDGAIWFTERSGGRIGRITTKGQVTEFSTGITPTEQPFDLAAGPDRAIWFTEYESSGSYLVNAKIGRISMKGKITEYSGGLNSRSQPTSIVEGPDQRLWFAETGIDETGRLTP